MTQSLIKELTSPVQMVAKIMRTSSFQYFVSKISQAGFLLFGSAIVAFLWSNIHPESYDHFWHQQLTLQLGSFSLSHSLAHWINEGLMTIFFLTVGLEIKREFLVGGLSDPKRAALPVAAAAGGMVVPGLIYAACNLAGDSISGWGIPMATDIAFSLAVLSILGDRVPFGLRLFLTAFAIADDLGAVLVIAFFYTPSVNLGALGAAAALVVLLFALNRGGVRHSCFYIVCCIVLWFAVAQAGLHATIAGVITAMFVPSSGKYDTDIFLKLVSDRLEKIRCRQDGGCGRSILVNRSHLNAVQEIKLACREVETPLQKLEHGLSSWVGYLILPLFALANAGVHVVGLDLFQALTHPITLGVTLGLLAGKPLGIFIFTFAIARILKAELIQGTTWTHILGAGFLGGIGFTMSLFIANLSFTQGEYLEYAKIGIMIGSFFSACGGYALLRWSGKPS
ncbi:Na+/H+ antiporter NhaA [Desulforhopalus singaporensis]|uniref:Na(+)/H(+) antiporter NhaA n=1 Tax=Desulforhopalus singaporensis TaxID=91360 RepID=A0A1H0S700_9BACT|nr:Na+/H+ antiporter NhaA [Desulforhopalus singaporensis]SDP37494.1 Na+:H+ antiporter, NhaA family [Desulforhopalus singaporensis]